MSDLHLKTGVTKIEPNKVAVRGYRIDELMGRAPFAGGQYRGRGIAQQVHDTSYFAEQPVEATPVPLLPSHHRPRLLSQNGTPRRSVPQPTGEPVLL